MHAESTYSIQAFSIESLFFSVGGAACLTADGTSSMKVNPLCSANVLRPSRLLFCVTISSRLQIGEMLGYPIGTWASVF